LAEEVQAIKCQRLSHGIELFNKEVYRPHRWVVWMVRAHELRNEVV
jgi:hypothetical protein